MSNMSYCRFRNTASDMSDCLEALMYRDISSDEEKSAAKRMLKEVLEFCEDEGIIDSFSSSNIDGIIGSCKDEDEEDEDD